MTCKSGEKGPGGNCECKEAIGWKNGEWKTPWCFQGFCYTSQAYDKCKNKDNSTSNNYALNDGTWCQLSGIRKGERITRCPTSSGN